MDELGIEILQVKRSDLGYMRSTRALNGDNGNPFNRHLQNLVKKRDVLNRIPAQDPVRIRLEEVLNAANLCIDSQKSDSFTPGAQENKTIYQAYQFPQERKGINRTCPPEKLSSEQLNRTVLEAYAFCPLSLVWLMETEKGLLECREPAWSSTRAEDWKDFDDLLILENVFPQGTEEPHKQLLPSKSVNKRLLLGSVAIELIRRSCVQCRYCNHKSTEGLCDFDHLLHSLVHQKIWRM